MNRLLTPEARMGNDIARQFAHRPTDEAVEAITAHIVRFWIPSMRANLSAQAAKGDDTLDPLLTAAAANLST